MTVPALTGLLPAEAGPVPYLTPRQRQVLALAANGHTNWSIGHQLGTSEQTVKSQMRVILKRLHVDDRTQAATVAIRIGLLSADDIDIPRALRHLTFGPQ